MMELGEEVKVVALVHHDSDGKIRKDGIFNPVHAPVIFSHLKKAAASGCPIVMGHNTFALARKHFDGRGEWRTFFPRAVVWSTSDTLHQKMATAGDARNLLVVPDPCDAVRKACAWAALFGKDKVYVIGGVDLFGEVMQVFVDEVIGYTDRSPEEIAGS